MVKAVTQRFRPLVFLKEVRTELSKVAWPSRPQAIRLTLIVLGVSVVVALFISGLDFVFTKSIGIILR